MKRIVLQQGRLLSLLAVAFLFIVTASIATAGGTTKVSDERKLKTEISSLNRDAAMPKADRIVMDELTKEFDVTSAEVKALREKDLGYGEIVAVYAFADKMSGGVTDENVNRIMSMQGKKGWGEIARELDVDLRDVSKKVAGIGKSVHEEIKEASAGTSGRGAGGVDESGRDRSEPLYQ
jgi:hypothetical protein